MSEQIEDYLEVDHLPLYPPRLSLAQIVAEHPDVVAGLKELDAMQTASAFGGLLTRPELQANCFRLEALVHLSLL